MRMNKPLHTTVALALLVLAILASDSASATRLEVFHGFTENKTQYAARAKGTIESQDYVKVNKMTVEIKAKEDGQVRDEGNCTTYAVLDADVACYTSPAWDTTINGESIYCADGRADFFDRQDPDEIWDTVQGSHNCTTPSGSPPEDLAVAWRFLGCHQPRCALWRFNYSADYATQFRLERKTTGGSWRLEEVLGDSAYVPHLGGNDVLWRIRGENQNGVSGWEIFGTNGECNEGGPGGGGSLD